MDGMDTRQTMTVTHYEGPATLTADDQHGERNVHATIRVWRETAELDLDDPYRLPVFDTLRWGVDITHGAFPLLPVGECTIACPGLGEGRTVVDAVGVKGGEPGWQGKLIGVGPAPGLA